MDIQLTKHIKFMLFLLSNYHTKHIGYGLCLLSNTSCQAH